MCLSRVKWVEQERDLHSCTVQTEETSYLESDCFLFSDDQEDIDDCDWIFSFQLLIENINILILYLFSLSSIKLLQSINKNLQDDIFILVYFKMAALCSAAMISLSCFFLNIFYSSSYLAWSIK